MAKVVDLINEIKTSFKDDRRTSSKQDEVNVMLAMMNDTSYSVDVYRRDGVVGAYNPAKEFRGMITDVVTNTVKINKGEAEGLVENYEFTKKHANTLVDLSKEFIQTYIHTERPINLGGRERSNITIKGKEIEAQYRYYPQKTDEVGPDGKPVYKKDKVHVPAHYGLNVRNKCPEWVK